MTFIQNARNYAGPEYLDEGCCKTDSKDDYAQGPRRDRLCKRRNLPRKCGIVLAPQPASGPGLAALWWRGTRTHAAHRLSRRSEKDPQLRNPSRTGLRTGCADRECARDDGFQTHRRDEILSGSGSPADASGRVDATFKCSFETGASARSLKESTPSPHAAIWNDPPRSSSTLRSASSV